MIKYNVCIHMAALCIVSTNISAMLKPFTIQKTVARYSLIRMNATWFGNPCGKNLTCCHNPYIRYKQGCAVKLAEERAKKAQRDREGRQIIVPITIPPAPLTDNLLAGAVTGLVVANLLQKPTTHDYSSNTMMDTTPSDTPTSTYPEDSPRHEPDSDPYYESGSTQYDSEDTSE